MPDASACSSASPRRPGLIAVLRICISRIGRRTAYAHANALYAAAVPRTPRQCMSPPSTAGRYRRRASGHARQHDVGPVHDDRGCASAVVVCSSSALRVLRVSRGQALSAAGCVLFAPAAGALLLLCLCKYQIPNTCMCLLRLCLHVGRPCDCGGACSDCSVFACDCSVFADNANDLPADLACVPRARCAFAFPVLTDRHTAYANANALSIRQMRMTMRSRYRAGICCTT